MRLAARVGAMAALVYGALTAQAVLICYEGFDYAPAPKLFGLNGGTGFNGAWQVDTPNGAYAVDAPGFTYNSGRDLYVTGNRAVMTNAATWGRPTRMVAGGPYGSDPGTTNWISCIMRLDSPTNENIKFHEITLHDGSAPGGPHLRLAAHNAFNPKWAMYVQGGPSAKSGVDIIPGQAVLLVARIIFYANPTQDYAVMWVNPSLTSEPIPSDPLAAKMYVSHFEWDRIDILSRERQFNLDEIRIGTTWDDVVPDEPTPVETPVNQLPTNGATGVSLTPVLQASAFSSSKTDDVHEASIFVLTTADGKSTVISTGAYTAITVPAGLLQPSTRYSWSVQYKGTNSPKWSALSAATSFETEWSHAPVLLAYDGAAYAAGQVTIANNNGGSGWSTPWQSVGTINFTSRVGVDTPGMQYMFTAPVDYLLVTNNKFKLSSAGVDFSNNPIEVPLSRAAREVGIDGAAHLLSGSYYGRTGTTNWFSFLIKYELGDTSARYGIGLNPDFANDAPYQFFIGKPAGENYWGVAGSNGVFKAVSSVSAIDGQPAFLVCRVVYGAADEQVHLWVNPTSRASEPSAGSADVATSAPNFFFRYIDVVAQAASAAPTVYIDELRFGSGWQQVMPQGPPPPPVVGTPTNVAPANGAVNVALPVTLQATPFVGAGAGDFHQATDLKLVSLNGVQTLYSTSGLTSVTLPAGVLSASTRYTWQVRYLGTNSSDWSQWSAPTVFTTAQGAPRLMAYDGCDYVPTNRIGGQARGFGWAGPWEEQIWNTLPPGTYYYTQVAAESNGLSYGDLEISSNRFVTTPNGWSFNTNNPSTESAAICRNRRVLRLDGAMHLVTSSNLFGKPGTTNWLSVLARFEGGSPKEFGVDYANNGDIGLLAAGLVPDTSTWGVWVPGTVLRASSTVDASSGTAFLVSRLISGETEDTLHLWVNPALGSQPPVSSAVELTGIPHIEFDRLGLRAEGSPAPNASLDELRFGDSWESVTPVIPEPAALLGVLALAALVRRR